MWYKINCNKLKVIFSITLIIITDFLVYFLIQTTLIIKPYCFEWDEKTYRPWVKQGVNLLIELLIFINELLIFDLTRILAVSR